MTTSLDTEVLAEVNSALSEVGVTATFTNEDVTVNKVQSSVSVGTPVVTLVTSTPTFNYEDSRINGDSIQHGDTYIITKVTDTSGNSWEPIIENMTVTFPNSSEGKTWRIVSVKRYKAGDDTQAYEIQLRG